MSFLTPLYLAALATVSLPILFHLIRRMPRGQVDFSTTRFLKPSPPTLTKQSRLENLLLLALRILAVVLLVLAFTRPFFRQRALAESLSKPARFRIILLDTSASMQRQGVWQHAIERVEELVEQSTDRDKLALITFADEATVTVNFDNSRPAKPAAQRKRLLAALKELKPGWGSTALGDALICAADELQSQAWDSTKYDSWQRQVVLVSDAPRSADIKSLRGYQWPEEVELKLEFCPASEEENTSLHWVASSENRQAGESVTVRVVNSSANSGQQVRLAWAQEPEDGSSPPAREASPGDQDATDTSAASDAAKPPEQAAADKAAEPRSVYVAAGKSQVVKMLRPQQFESRSLQLLGDADGFDDQVFVAPQQTVTSEVTILGGGADGDVEGLSFYLRLVLQVLPNRNIVVRRSLAEADSDAGVPVLIVLARPATTDEAEQLSNYVQAGGTVLTVLTPSHAGDEATLPWLAPLLEADDAQNVDIREFKGVAGDYRLLGSIDFRHPLFTPFAEARFNNFNKILFWRHRTLDLPESFSGDIIAKFDNGDPALIHVPKGDGHNFVLTSGWQPADSQLARSSKFVPLLTQVLTEFSNLPDPQFQFEVGQSIRFANLGLNSVDEILLPDETQITAGKDDTEFTGTEKPGIYVLANPMEQRIVAVNLPASEVQYSSLETDDFVQLGLTLQASERALSAEVKRENQMRNTELEREQRVWQWLLAAALLALIAETLLAAYHSHRQLQPVANSQPQ